MHYKRDMCTQPPMESFDKQSVSGNFLKLQSFCQQADERKSPSEFFFHILFENN